ncbi:PREDICTED: sensory neuron membrane protein 1 [Ceratosolen solmsi marchali]|uniref:Sensory neuron membrane protein 1 n=1 Tax=Ceratosolen solmsi marchali TaxID=326594 RepID=A0AAJ7DWT9_9HYME|nr:PREDICTED: sensory neuron membrane protein 1 [Ceratosolen solmsi marchali]
MQRFLKYGIAGLCLFVFGIMFGWLIFPKVLKSKIHSQVALKPGSDMRGMWSKLPFALEFRVYLFNVTNPDEIKAGQKPILREVGPFFFEEWQEKTELIDREEDDSVEFSIKNKWIFKSEMSEGLTGDEELILPHIFILAMVMTTYREKPTMLPVINKAINSIFKNPSNIFIKMKAMDLLFYGLPIDCTVQDFAATAVCTMLKDSTDLLKDGEDKYKFSLFGAKNDTSSKSRLRVLRGTKNLMDVGVVVEFNGKPNISLWDDDYCDTFNGTDGTIFHPFFYESEDVVSFAPDLCRSLSTTFSEKVHNSGMILNRYTAFLGDPNTIPSQRCYCQAPDKCLKKGVMDLYKCAGIPLVASHPHFYLGDKDYLDMVDGLNPSKEEHGIFLDMEPFSGTPLTARKRLQFNIMIHKLEKFKIMKQFPDALLPLFWVEEGVALPQNFVAQVKTGIQVVTIVTWIKWIMVVCGFGLCGIAGFMYYRMIQQSNKLEITQVASAKAKSSISEQTMEPIDASNLQASNVLPQVN